MYIFTISLCLAILGGDVCLILSKRKFTTTIENELADQEQIEYLKNWNQERGNRIKQKKR